MTELSLSTAANIAEIIGAGSIITGLIFGWFQIRHFQAQQRDAVAINLMQTFYDQDLAHAIALLQPVPDDITLEQPSWGEWFEWLGDQALAHKSEKTPAYQRHSDWTP